MPGTPIPWTFKTWIANFKGVNLPIGDLADDIMSDPDFPEVDSFNAIHDYLYEKASHPNVMETFILAWNFYQASK
ncbi:hypothetical protein J416_09314 [Gracilibacillus halophilus YIM-C55.5]|uniref:YozE SAM-like domain-containing protein n=1 Tax=Gracilibacillus halophilus YIM-C55.5 TaxID=1308866 RepID=N4WQF2_9BACI|nr:YozE family protein [Gracilibacillus halophilus]ENH96685.1 hypothetical protein J416_09314 [Gracilibacillus halophilus YIM-C55.5]